MIKFFEDENILQLPFNKKISFVIGPGRCGFKAYYKLLFMQKNIKVDYEFYRIRWEDPIDYGLANAIIRLYGLLSLYKDTYLAVSIAHYFLPYFEKIIEMYPETRFICLKRNKEETVQSLILAAKTRNFWTDTSSKFWDTNYSRGKFYYTFPSFDLPRSDAAAKYYDHYFEIVSSLINRYPDHAKLYNVPEVFEDKMLQHESLEFLGVNNPVVRLGLWKK